MRFDGRPTISAFAFNLYCAASVSSVKAGHSGFVSDDYLNTVVTTVAADTTTAAWELEAAGMWQRRDGGYFIADDEIVRTVIGFNEQSDREQAECARRGAHIPSPTGHIAGWLLCHHCGIPLERPDDGPVALPGGGPLAP